MFDKAPACFELLEDRTLPTVYIVNGFADTIDASDGVVSLREAITAANTNAASGNAAAGSADGDVITFSLNALQRMQLDPALGQYEITDDLVIDGSSNATRIALSGERGTRVFRVNAAAGPGTEHGVELRSFNIVSGQGVGAGSAGGGAILVEAASDLTLRDVSVSGGRTAANGGGIANAGRLSLFRSIVGGGTAKFGGGVYNAGTLSLFASWVIQNTATGRDSADGGGGIYNAGGEVTVEGNSLVDLNRALHGAGIFSLGGRLRVTGGGILHNTALWNGGGVEARAGGTAYDVRLAGVSLSYNIAGANVSGNLVTGSGGGLHTTGAGMAAIDGGAVIANIASKEGGGLWNSAGATMTATGVRIRGNVAARGRDDGDTVNAGGGIFNAGLLSVSETRIEQNLAKSYFLLGLGGGIANGQNVTGAAGTTRVTNSIIEKNGAGVGGGLHNGGSLGTMILEVTSSTVQLNVALRYGGGVANGGGIDGGGRLIVRSSTLTRNTAVFGAGPGGGAGLFNGNGAVNGSGNASPGGTAEMTATFVTFNHTQGAGRGGGIQNGPGGRLRVIDSTIDDNVAEGGGGGVADVAGGAGLPANSVLLAGVFLRTNTAAGSSDGGALHSSGAGNVALFRNVITGNFAANDGGGIWLSAAGTVRLDQSNIAQNSAVGGDGGGLFLLGTGLIDTSLIASNHARFNGGGFWMKNALSFVNSTVGGNDAGRFGGGVYVDGDFFTYDRVLFANATIARNWADSDGSGDTAGDGVGGGVFIAGVNARLHNTVVALNVAGPAAGLRRDDMVGTPDFQSAFNLIGASIGASLINGINSNRVGTPAAPIDPKLGPLAENGGPTRTYLPLAGSPLVDKGKEFLVTRQDQRLRRRPVDIATVANASGGDGSDIGAVELQT